MRKLIAFAVIAAALTTTLLATAACNTVAGAGRDVTSVGRKVTETAK